MFHALKSFILLFVMVKLSTEGMIYIRMTIQRIHF
jgi:hypothetical protein